jgi:hypothetical protein
MADNLTIGIGADSTKLRADLAVAQAALKDFSAQLRQVAQESLKGGDASGIKDVAAAYNQASANVSRLKDQVKQAGTAHKDLAAPMSTARNAVNELRTSFGNLGKSVEGLATGVFPRFNAALAALVGAGSVTGLAALFKGSADAVRETENVSKALGVTTDYVEAYRLHFAKFGVSAEDADKAMERLFKTLGQSRQETAKLTGEIGNSGTVLRGGIAGVTSAVEVLKGGQKDLTSATSDQIDVLRGGVKAVRDFSDPFKALRIDTSKFTDDTKGNSAAIAEWAKRFGTLGDSSLKASIGASAVGRAFGAVIAPLATLKEGMEAARHEIEASGTGLSKNEEKQASAFKAFLATATTVFNRVREIVFNALGSVFVPVFQEITQILTNNSAALREWSNKAASYIKPVITDLLAASRGEQGPPQTASAQSLLNIYNQLRSAVTAVGAAFRGLRTILDGVAAVINTVFGTDFNATTLAAILVVGRLTGAFGLLRDAIGLVRAALSIAAWITTPVGLAVVALGLLGLAFYQNRDAILAFWERVKEWGAGSVKWIGDVVTKAGDLASYIGKTLIDAWNGLWDSIDAGVQKVLGWLGDIISKAGDVISKLAGALGLGGGGGASVSAASGGHIQGPGTGTSDSILAAVSNDEFIVRSAVVRQPGMLALLHAINGARVGVSQAWAGLRGFAMGGLVDALAPRSMPHFAEGGLVSAGAGGTPFNLIISGETFGGLTAPEDVAGRLVRFATSSNLKSAGPKPGWYAPGAR